MAAVPSLSFAPRSPCGPVPRRAEPRALRPGQRLAAAGAAAVLRGLVPRQPRRGHRSAARAFLASDAETAAASEVKLGKFLSWARRSEAMKLHPCLSFGSGGLQLSVPVSKGTPIMGVLDDAFLSSSVMPEPWQKVLEGARQRYPDWWSLHLGIMLLKESSLPSSDAWEAYQNCVAPHPASPSLWTAAQAQELQYVPMKKAVQQRIQAIQEFHDKVLVAQLGSEGPSVFDAARAIAWAAAQGIEVGPGQRAFVPLLDMVGPPEATVAAGQSTPEPNCELQVEQKGGPGGRDIAMLVATRDLDAGQPLCRELPGLADELLLEHGLAAGDRRDDVTIHVGLKKGVVEAWQLSTLREVMDLERGEGPGDFIASAKVRRSSILTTAVDAKLLAAARVLSSKSREEALGAEWNLMTKDEILNAGLEGLSSTRRRRLLWVLKRAVEGALASYDTTVVRDQELLPCVAGREQVAVAYRLGKKMILQDLQAQLEKADEKIRTKRALREKEAALPTVVTGKKKPATPGKGFG